MKRVCLFILILLFFVAACTNAKQPDEFLLQNENGTFTIKTEQATYENYKVVYTCKDRSEDIRSATVYGLPFEEYVPVLVVQAKERTLCFELSSCAGFYPIVNLCDLTGDGKDEVLVLSTRTANGIGVYTTYVLDVGETSLEVLYRFPSYDYEYSGPEPQIPWEELNLGFKAEVLPGWRIQLTYGKTNQTFVLEVPQELCRFVGVHDDKGDPNQEELVLHFGTFYRLEAVDTDGDGTFEIVADQSFSFGTMRNSGTAVLTLKYDAEIQSFEIIDVKIESAELNV